MEKLAVKQRKRELGEDDDDIVDELDNAATPPDIEDSVEMVPYKGERYSEEEMVKRSAGLYAQMNKRRTLRFFSDEAVPREVIENIVKTAGTSPSGGHTEPWTYVVVSLNKVGKG